LVEKKQRTCLNNVPANKGVESLLCYETSLSNVQKAFKLITVFYQKVQHTVLKHSQTEATFT